MRRWRDTLRCSWSIAKWGGNIVRLAAYAIGTIIAATARGDL